MRNNNAKGFNIVGTVDIEKIYQSLAKYLSEDKDYVVKFIITKKEDE